MHFRELLPILSDTLEEKHKDLDIEAMKVKRFDEKSSSAFYPPYLDYQSL